MRYLKTFSIAKNKFRKIDSICIYYLNLVRIPQNYIRELWNGNNANDLIVSTGIYFYWMTVYGISKTKKMILLR